jgi:predicted secreted hydrolase
VTFLILILGFQSLWSEKFRYPERGGFLKFPRDHGSHPDYKSEWWYITGHFTDDADIDYGFQLTFFRSASDEENGDEKRQTYMAHVALTDITNQKYLCEERFNKEGWNAGAREGTLDVFNGNWFLRMDEDSESMKARFSIAGMGVISIQMNPLKPRVLFGDNGYSKKGEDLHAASYYITFSRLELKGEVDTGKGKRTIKGECWMDHEYSSSHLSANQIGWDWASLQLADGREIMAYSMRRDDGKIDPFSSFNVISQDGQVESLYGDSFQWRPVEFWTSPISGGRYPVVYEISWKNSAGSEEVLRIQSLMDEQEFDGKISGFHYWEGACEVLNREGERVGMGYTEMTGYHQSLNGRF